ncbi:MAG: nickel pincer cofactor biosynthesis protein LarB [Promethearchaeota archaeon]
MPKNNERRLVDLLHAYKNGEISEDQLLKEIKLDHIEKIGNLVNADIFRDVRVGVPEVIYAESKTVSHLLEIIKVFLKKSDSIIVSRLNKDQIDAIKEFVSENKNKDWNYDLNELGRIIRIFKNTRATVPEKVGTKSAGEKKRSVNSEQEYIGLVGIITAGTSDIPIAEEARMVVEEMGVKTILAYDVGIAGFHRIFAPLKEMLEADVDAIICIAGMEGTLPGVVSALVDVPVIGVPASVGYGFGAKGETAIRTMLQSCSPGLSVVNIDNGVGAGAFAALIALNTQRKLKKLSSQLSKYFEKNKTEKNKI